MKYICWVLFTIKANVNECFYTFLRIGLDAGLLTYFYRVPAQRQLMNRFILVIIRSEEVFKVFETNSFMFEPIHFSMAFISNVSFHPRPRALTELQLRMKVCQGCELKL